MARLRKVSRFISHLLISVFLLLAPVTQLFTAAPVKAAPAPPSLRLPWQSGTFPITTGYDCGYHKNHDIYALDFDVDPGLPVTAAIGGTVHVPAEVNGYGKHVIVENSGWKTIYAHLNTIAVSEGNTVGQGAVLGTVGMTGGTSSGPHIHFVLRYGGTPNDRYNGEPVKPVPMSGYTSFDGIPCSESTVYGSYNPSGTPPGGWWQGPTPNDNSLLTPGTAVTVGAHGVDNGNGGLDKINVTYYAQNVGWQVLKTTWFPASASGDATAAFIMPDLPYVLVSFDVYSKNGKYHKAPSGLRKFCNAWTTSTCAHATGDGNIGGPATGGGSSSSSGCTPGQYQAAVFTDANYGGSCVLKGIGEYRTPEAIGLPNDSISSIKVGSGANVRLCDNSELNSPCEYFSADDPELNNNSINTNTVSSMKVEGGGPTTNCQPGESEVAFFMNENYQETCTIRGIGRYDDPSALGLPNDTISSVKVGARVQVRICDNAGNNSPCDQFDRDVPDLGPTTVQNNKASSAEVTSRGGIALCDNTNYGGECKYFGAGLTGESPYNMAQYGFDNRVESVRYDPDWDGKYHIVLYTEPNQTGALYHADNSKPDLLAPYNNNISSIKIYRHQPPNSEPIAPANGAVLPAGTTSVLFEHRNGPERRIHIWNNSGYDVTTDWFSGASDNYTINDLPAGTYNWQIQGRNHMGEGQWSAVWTFSINTPPTVVGGNLTMDAGTSQSIQVQAFDNTQASLTMSTSGLPSFATFADNGSGMGTLTLNPSASQSGQYNITVTANDGSLTGSGVVQLTVAATQPAGYQAEYFNNRTLGGTPVLTRTESEINNDWGGGSPGSGVPVDNFSARWTKTTDFAAGTYAFSVTADDGVRLYVDNVLVIDKWIDQGPTTYTADRTLTAGSHTVKMEYYENGGGATARMSYAPVQGQTPTNDYQAQYFANRTLTGNPVLTRSETSVDYDWGGGSPGSGVPVDNFSARWTKTANFNAGDYKFTATGDDGLRLFIDGQKVIDKWIDQGPTSYDVTLNLAAGNHTIVYEYYEAGGGAVARLNYQQVTTTPPPSIPPTAYTGQYFANRTLSGSPVLTRGDNTIDFDWGGGSPGAGVPVDNFSARWTKTSDFSAGTYRFTATGDDGIRLFIDGQLVIDKWIDQGPTAYTADRTLTAGNHTVVYEYYDSGGGAVARLSVAPVSAPTPPPPPPPSAGTELLTAPWNLVGNNGASEKYQSINANALAGKTTMRITYNLHGINAIGGDASAIIFDQNGWKYVSLASYGQNGLNGTQTVDIPLSHFGLNLSQPVGTLHTRFWYGSAFTVDITSIQVF